MKKEGWRWKKNKERGKCNKTKKKKCKKEEEKKPPPVMFIWTVD